ncbi:MAG: MBL fold metallo-hydrolase [Spirochaetales bacterium]|nr:MBL fold metallo-hydrolase [Leptospiraceae bacterium]MCP5483088.1 MBL fold metallo-hydrolase [Spirochaetales bacterium]MCP5486104.1 MBL fold metallo-hydrolase [Spirochaetales bacterium]
MSAAAGGSLRARARSRTAPTPRLYAVSRPGAVARGALIRMVLVCVPSLLAAACAGLAPSSQALIEHSPVTKFEIGIANVYLVQGHSGLVLIDTSVAGAEQEIEEAIRSTGHRVQDVKLIVLTHCHGDHAGAAPYFQSTYHIPIMAGAGDLSMCMSGHNDELKPTSLFAYFVKLLSNKTYRPFRPNILVENERSLEEYGLAATVRPMPGHTDGSLVVLLNDREAVVGDLIRGSMTNANVPTEHFFHKDRSLWRTNLARLLQEGYVLFWVGHWGPVDAREIYRAFPDIQEADEVETGSF